MQEKTLKTLPAKSFIAILLLTFPVIALMGLVTLGSPAFILFAGAGVTYLIFGFYALTGFYTLEHNQAAVHSRFGKYVGTDKEVGLRWAWPWLEKNVISLRIRNFESGLLKVNDLNGSPIELAAIVVWQVKNAAQATYSIQDFASFVEVQSEAAIRQMASIYPYDSRSGEMSLRGDSETVSERLRDELEKRLHNVGVHIVESRISHLAYAPEIAQAMLQRQQASAVIDARKLIVDGAVDIVTDCIERLEQRGRFQITDEGKALMASNLLVVLCSERTVQPVVAAS